MKALSTKELISIANDTRRPTEIRIAARDELVSRPVERRLTLRHKICVGLFLLAGLILGGHADAETVLCPVPTTSNSGMVGTDENGDGYIDHLYRVYTSGPCAGETVSDEGTAEITVHFGVSK